MKTEPMGEQAIFERACAIEAEAQRDAYVREACGEDEQLLQRVLHLLELYAASPSFLEQPAEGVLDATVASVLCERPGMSIGPYKLLEQIGDGGFGVVFMAQQQEPVRRKVALKVIKPGMDTQEVIARFEAERQALALMDHPNIAKVLDAGATDTGRPFFVMELLRGVPITSFCDQNSMTMRERLDLFTGVCQAVQHAHQKGIIHRDIKPSNVLVTLRDDRPIAKIIDFGVAKAINQRLTEKTVFTRFAQMIGTPLYMSPEQAGLSEFDVDTRSDIYSLGVLLYEILTGVTPFDRQRMREAAYHELLRIIREEEPLRPSLRISTLGDKLPSVAAQRNMEPRKLSAVFRGELDWILMKALEKDRNRRYETAGALAADVTRYLQDEPVEACPPSRLYLFRKFAHRNKAAITTAALVAISLLVGLAGTTWALLRAVDAEVASREQFHVAESARQDETRQRRLAEKRRIEAEEQRRLADEQARRALAAEEDAKKEEAIAEAVVKFFTNDVLAQAQPDVEKNRDITLRAVVDRASERIQDRFDDQPSLEAAIRETLGRIYQQLGLYDKAERHYRRAAELLKDASSERASLHRLSILEALAAVLTTQEKYADGIAHARAVFAGRTELLGDHHPDTLAAQHNLAVAYSELGRRLESEEVLRDILRVSRDAGFQCSPHVLHSLAVICRDDGRYAEAEKLFRQSIDSCAAEHPDKFLFESSLGNLFLQQGRYTEAEQQFCQVLDYQRSVLSDLHPNTQDTMRNLLKAVALNRSSRCAELAVEVGKSLVDQSGDSTDDWISLACAYYRNGSWEPCLAALDRVEEIRAARIREGQLQTYNLFVVAKTIFAIRRLASWQLGNRRQPEVGWQSRVFRSSSVLHRFYQEELEHLWLGLGPQYSGWAGLARNRMRQGLYSEAAVFFRKMVEREVTVLGEVNSLAACTLYHQGFALRKAGQSTEARNSFLRAIDIFNKLDESERLTAAQTIVEATESACVFSFEAVRQGKAGELPTRTEIREFLEDAERDPQARLHKLALVEKVLQHYPQTKELGWRLERVVGLRGVRSPRYEIGDDAIVVSRSASGPGTAHEEGVFRIERDGRCRKMAAAQEINDIRVDPQGGDIYFCEIGCGAINRLSREDLKLRTWVSTIRMGDSDPAAIAFPPTDAGSSLLSSGEGIFVECGRDKQNGVYRFSLGAPGKGELIISDGLPSGPAFFPKDVAIGREAIYVAGWWPEGDDYSKSACAILRIGPDGTTRKISVNHYMRFMHGIAIDATTSELLVYFSNYIDHKLLVRVDPETGQCRDVLSNIYPPGDEPVAPSLDISPDGKRLFLAAPNIVLVFVRALSDKALLIAATAQSSREQAADYMTKQQWELAIDELESASRLWRDDLESLELQARAYLALGDGVQFERICQEVVQRLQDAERIPVAKVFPLGWLWGRLSILCSEADQQQTILQRNTEVIEHLKRLSRTAPCRQTAMALRECYWSRAMLLHKLGRHDEAVADCEASVDLLLTDAWFWRRYAIAALIAHGRQRYDTICREMLDQLAQTKNIKHRGIVVECCTVMPLSTETAEALLAFAEPLKSSEDPVNQTAYARALLRAGRPQESASLFSQTISNWESEGASWNCWADWFLLAIAHHRCGHTQQAKSCYLDGIKWTKRHQEYAAENSYGIDPHILFRWELFRREAEDVLGLDGENGQNIVDQSRPDPHL